MGLICETEEMEKMKRGIVDAKVRMNGRLAEWGGWVSDWPDGCEWVGVLLWAGGGRAIVCQPRVF